MGGAEAALFHFLEYAKKHHASEHAVAYVHSGPFVDRIKKLGIPVYDVSGWLLTYDLGTYVKLFNIIRAYKPNLLHTSLWSANMLGRMLAYRFSLPLISEVHGDCRVVSARWKNWVDAQMVVGMTRHKLVAVAQGVRDAYQTAVLDTIKEPLVRDACVRQLMVISNGIDGAGLRQRAAANPLTRVEFGLGDNDFVIGSVGRFELVKSYDVLLQAFKKAWLPGMKLFLVGNGSQRSKLEQMAQDLEIASLVVFVGQRIDAYRFYPLFDVFALSSQTEGLSIALLEALAFGLPIVTTNDGPKHEVLVDGRNGLLVPINDVDAYAAALRKLMKLPTLGMMMSQENNVLSQSYDLAKVADQYQDLYRDLMQ